MRKILTLLTVLSLSALVLAACGRDESASSASSLAPADSAVYAEFTLEPEGDQKRAIDAIVAKFPGSGSAGARLQELIEQGLREADAPITYRDDIKPWLGDEGAFFATAGGRSAELDTAAALLATDDEESARDALEKSFEGKAKEKSYKDVDYLLADDGETAAAVTDGVVVLGSKSGLEAALDAADGGSRLSDDEDYETALQDAAKDRLGLFYLNSPELFKATAQWQGAALPGSFRKFFEEPYVATVAADEDGVVFEASTPEALAKTVPFLGQGSELVNELPADSWLALAQPDLGKLADFYIDAFAPVAGGRDTIEGQFKAVTGLDLESEVLGWMGDFAVFARGTSKADLDGGLVVETTDPAATEKFLRRLLVLARAQNEPGTTVTALGLPGGGQGFSVRDADLAQPVHVVLRGDRLVVAYGDSAAEDAFDPAERLGDAPEFSAAAESLDGYEVSFYLAMGPVFDLIDSTPAAAEPGWQQAKPYLEPLSALVGGTSGDGDELRSAFRLIIE